MSTPVSDMILLTGVELGVRRASLDASVRLKRPTRTERQLLETLGMIARARAHSEQEEQLCVMSLLDGLVTVAEERPLTTILTPLRLVKAGKVGSVGAVASTITGDWEEVQWWANPELVAPRLGDPPYNLLSTDVRRLRKLWRLVGDISTQWAKCPSWLQATRRFNRSYSYRPGDQAERMTELIAALEALFLYETDELAYRLALRASYFLTAEPAARRDIFDLLKAAYRVRSKAVHGERAPATVRIRGVDVELEHVTNALEDVVRASLIRYMSLLRTIPEAKLKRTLLDDLVVEGGQSPLRRAAKRT